MVAPDAAACAPDGAAESYSPDDDDAEASLADVAAASASSSRGEVGGREICQSTDGHGANLLYSVGLVVRQPINQ